MSNSSNTISASMVNMDIKGIDNLEIHPKDNKLTLKSIRNNEIDN